MKYKSGINPFGWYQYVKCIALPLWEPDVIRAALLETLAEKAHVLFFW